MQLRDYQNSAVWAIWSTLLGHRTALCVMSTGSGKSIVIAGLIAKALKTKPDAKFLILFNKVTLLDQLAKRFADILGQDIVGVVCGTLDAYQTDKSITVASIQSLKKENNHFDWIIIDECHNIDDESGRYIELVKHQIEVNPRTKLIGFTATPYRHDGYIYGEGKLWSKPCYEKGLTYFIEKKMLVSPIAKQPDYQLDLSKMRVRLGEYMQSDIDAQTLDRALAKDQIIDALNRMTGRKKAVWFCASIDHAEMVKELLSSLGEAACTVHSKQAWPIRDAEMEAFTEGEARHLTFVSVVSEGFDYPPIDCVVLMRPTKSPTLMVQTCGRGLRPFEGKENCLILDYAKVISTLGPLDNPYIKVKIKGKDSGKEMPTKTCPQCRSILTLKTSVCPDCGYDFPSAIASKLNLEADEQVDFLSIEKKPKELDVMRVELSAYNSKNGNKCLKVTYHGNGYLSLNNISEFFVEKPFAWKKWEMRAVELGCQIMPTIESQLTMKPTRKPSKIVYSFQDKFPRVHKLIF